MPVLSQETTSVSAVANQLLRKEKTYNSNIEQNINAGNSLASRISRGDLALLGAEFTTQYCDKLKDMMKHNVNHQRNLKAYLKAIKSVKNNYNPEVNDGDKDDGYHSFQQRVDEGYSTELEKIEKQSILIIQEPAYLTFLENLGERYDEDDELAVVNEKPSDDNVKCPLSLTIMKDPVRSRICKHAFSRAAIVEHLRQNKICPVPGCSNRSMTAAELEDDDMMVRLVRRFKKREEHQKRRQAEYETDDEGS